MPDHFGLDEKSLLPVGKLVLSSSLEKLHPVGGDYMNFLELPQTFISKEQKAKMSTGDHFLGSESTLSISMSSFGSSDQKILSQSNLCMLPAVKGFHYDNNIFSSSFSEVFSNKLRLMSNDTCFVKSLDSTNPKFVEDEPLESMKEIEAQMIGDLLPNDDDLLSGVIDDVDCVAQTNSGDEDDLFYSGGGMEMEYDESLNRNIASGFPVRRTSDCQIDSLRNIVASELVHGEQPTRALIVRNVKSNIEEADLRILFEQFGDIHAFYTANRHLGFILVSYYDLRAARNAKRALQDGLLRQQKLDIQFYFPKDNGPDNDNKHATLTVVNLDSGVSKDQLHQIFGSYGEIKEIFHDLCNQNQIAIEFYDVRAAEAAFRSLNMSIIAGKRIMIEHGCPGAGWKRKSGSPSHQSSVSSGSITYTANTSMGIDNGSMHSSILQSFNSPLMETGFPRISTMSQNTSSPIRATERHHGDRSSHNELSNSSGQMNFGFKSMPTIHPHSLPELNDGLISSIPFSSLSTISPIHTNMSCHITDGIDSQHFCRVGAGCINSHSFEHKEAFGVSGNGSYPVNGHQYVLNSSANFHQLSGSLPWRNLPLFMNNISAPLPPQSHGLPRGPSHLMNAFVPLHQHHVGSDPAIKPSLWEKCNAYARDGFEVPFHPASVGNMGISASSPIHALGIPSQNMYTGINYIDPLVLPAHIGSPSLQQRSHLFHGRNNMTSAPASYDTSGERIRSRRNDSSAVQADNNKQFELDVDRIIHGEDSRTTLMIKNIPNKYTSKMLLATIDEQHKGSYDFIYLPIDFKNKCNVGYAFINLIDPKHIIPFYQAFNGKKWEKFNSEKVASLAYARIQGKAALISHFQNSSLMNEDKRCRPILFHSDGPNAGGQEPFPMGTHIRSRPSRTKTFNSEENCQASPSESDYGNGEEQSNRTESPSIFNKDSE